MNSLNRKHPFLNYLQQNDFREEGWIRKFLPCNTNQNEIQKELTNDERIILVTTYNLFSGFAKTYGPLEGWQKLFYNAWGVTKWTTNRIINSYYDNGFVANRKIREDKGLTLINSAKKRKSTYTPLYVYKREQTQKRYRTHTLRLDAKTLKEEFENKHEDEQVVYRNIADNFKHQGFSLHHNILKLLKKLVDI